MTRRDKLVQRIVKRPASASFQDVRQVLQMYDWTHARTNGSHATFTRPGEYPITVPVHDKRVTRFYLDDICRRLGLDEELED